MSNTFLSINITSQFISLFPEKKVKKYSKVTKETGTNVAHGTEDRVWLTRDRCDVRNENKKDGTQQGTPWTNLYWDINEGIMSTQVLPCICIHNVSWYIVRNVASIYLGCRLEWLSKWGRLLEPMKLVQWTSRYEVDYIIVICNLNEYIYIYIYICHVTFSYGTGILPDHIAGLKLTIDCRQVRLWSTVGTTS